MSIVLTEDQQRVLDNSGEQPARIVDPRTNSAYVLVSEVDFESVREVIEDANRNRVIRRIALRNAIGRMQEPT